MKKYIIIILVALVSFVMADTPPFRKLTKEEKTAIRTYAKTIDRKDGRYHVLIMTSMGDIVLRLYNETPLHRDNFVEKVRTGFYDSLLFHRVINQFMIQGGDPNSKKSAAGQTLGAGSAPGERIPAEFRTDQHIYHKRGALAAARDGNPQKASSNCQFYLVQRKPWRAGELDTLVRARRLSISEEQRQLYIREGGTPHLDGAYTVFGEIESGLEVVDKIAAVKTASGDRPLADIRMRMFILSEPKKK